MDGGGGVTTFLPVCPDTDIERINCPCSSCAEFRETWRDKMWEDARDQEWDRREASRREDRREWCRINGRCW